MTNLFFALFSSTAEGEGIHWFFLAQRQKGYFELFDSLGIKGETVKEILKNFSGECHFNETAFQAKDSAACGAYCIFFAVIRYFNQDLDFAEVIHDHFNSNLGANERKVTDLIAYLNKKTV